MTLPEIPPPKQASEDNSFSELLDSTAPREHGRDKKAKKTLLDNLRPAPEIEALWVGTTTAEEDAAHEESLMTTGPVGSILADEQGNIIKGHRCYRVYKKHKIKEVWVTVLTGLTSEQKLHLAVRLSAHHRHLTTSKKKEIVRKLLKANPKLSARYLGRVVGVDHHTAQDVKNAMIAGGEIPHLDIDGEDGKTYRAKGITTTLRNFKKAAGDLATVKEIAGVVTHRKVRNQIAEERRQEAARKGAEMTDPANTRLVHCDFRDLLAREPAIERSAGLILTDYPYQDAFLHLLPGLAAFAKRVLMPGGWFVTYAGTAHLDQVIAVIGAQLRYVWTFALPFSDSGNHSSYGNLNIYQLWRPVLVFHNGTPDNCRIATNIHDRFHASKSEKDWHPWQQVLAVTLLLVKTFSLDRDLVVDPLGGGFTTGAAVMQAGQGRRFVGCDIVKASVDTGRNRLNILASELPLP